MDRHITPTILVIDDYDSVRIAISMILRKAGFNVVAADGPDAARKIWAEHRSTIDLLLVDISMPVTSGPDLVRELLAKGPPVPVIFATGVGDAKAREATQGLPHPLILQKPFSPELLIELVKTQCGPVPVAS